MAILSRKIDLNIYHFILLMLLVDVTTAHVRLTYPMGRTYDLDFLDNVRTRGPCGMNSTGKLIAPGNLNLRLKGILVFCIIRVFTINST